MKSNSVSVAEFDLWRREYAQGQADIGWHRAFYARVADVYPVQCHYAWDEVRVAILHAQREHGSALKVVELGGWDGELAWRSLREFPQVEHWDNFEVAPLPRFREHPCLTNWSLDTWAWEAPEFFRAGEGAHLFVASHTLAHLTDYHLHALLARLQGFGTPLLYLDLPLAEWDQDWMGYHGSHVLPYGWPRLEAVLAEYGYWRLTWLTERARVFRKE